MTGGAGATRLPQVLRQLPLGVFLAGSGAWLLAATAPAGLLAATHSWKQPARVRPALDTSAGTTTLPCVHSGIDSDMPVKTRGTGLYHDLPLHWTRWRSHEGEEAAPRARRKLDPTASALA